MEEPTSDCLRITAERDLKTLFFECRGKAKGSNAQVVLLEENSILSMTVLEMFDVGVVGVNGCL